MGEPTEYERVLAALMAAPGCKSITFATGTSVLFMPTVPPHMRNERRRRLPPPLPVRWTIKGD